MVRAVADEGQARPRLDFVAEVERCPDCGGPLEAQDNRKIIELLKTKIVLSQNLKISID